MMQTSKSIRGENERSQTIPKRVARTNDRIKTLGFFGNDTSGARYERATSCRALENAFRLVHDVYVESGYILPHPAGIKMRHFDCAPDTGTFVASTPSHATVGVISVIMDSPDFGLPSDGAYKREIDVIRGQDRILCEFSNQAVLKAFRRKGPSSELMRCAFAYAYSMGATDIVFAISPSVISFYEMFHFNLIGPTRNYSNVVDDPVVLMSLTDIQTRGETAPHSHDAVYRCLMRSFYQDNPFFRRLDDWHRSNQGIFDDHFNFFSLLRKCPEIAENEVYRIGLERRLGLRLDVPQRAVASPATGRAHRVGRLRVGRRRNPARKERCRGACTVVRQRRSGAPLLKHQEQHLQLKGRHPTRRVPTTMCRVTRQREPTFQNDLGDSRG
jgi:hypothetical protein